MDYNLLCSVDINFVLTRILPRAICHGHLFCNVSCIIVCNINFTGKKLTDYFGNVTLCFCFQRSVNHNYYDYGSGPALSNENIMYLTSI